MSWLAKKGLMAIDPRPDRGGWIRGGSFRRCAQCSQEFLGALKSIECAGCAHAEQAPLDLEAA
jgi:hypothetical protein